NDTLANTENNSLGQILFFPVFHQCNSIALDRTCQERVTRTWCVASPDQPAPIVLGATHTYQGETVSAPQSTQSKRWWQAGHGSFPASLCQQVWDDAYAKALALADTEGWVSVHPFDHPLIWQGHASMVRELKDLLGHKPGAIVLAVGGGGLLAGVVAGLQDVGWQDVPIIAVETKGADSFNAALKAGRLVTLPEITSVAKCLGAKTVSARALECASECQVISQLVEDVEAVQAVELFLDDERMLVQPACGAPLALLYMGRVQQLQREGHLNPDLDSIVVIVCGGSSIQLAGLQALKTQLGMK
uniref:L-serine deaminase n=1 Tax=Chelonoidis abingdonii TaxID=106734 RepID=A0A8C0GWZ4_CHEAB